MTATEIKYTNRYGDEYSFTKNDDGDILWEGPFKHLRIGYPNNYKPAYQAYCKDASDMGVHAVHIEEFKELVHEQIYDAEGRWLHAGPISQRYQNLVTSITSELSMVDPSGGPYIAVRQDLGSLDPVLSGLKVHAIKSNNVGYLITTYRDTDQLEQD